MLDHIKSLDLMFHQIAPLQLQCIAAGHRAMHRSGQDAGKKKKEKMQKTTIFIHYSPSYLWKCRSLFIKDRNRLYTSFSCISSQPSRPNKNLPTSLEVTHFGFENWLRSCAAILEAMSLSAGWLAGTLAPPVLVKPRFLENFVENLENWPRHDLESN